MRPFLQNYVDYFHLNVKDYKVDELYRFYRDVVDKRIVDISKGVYNNYVVDLFIEKLVEFKSEDVCND